MARARAMRIKYEVEGVDAAVKALSGVGIRAQRPAPVLDRIERDFYGRIAPAEFDSSGGYARKRWAKLAAATIEAKQAAGLDNGILIATGRLRAAAEGHGGGDSETERSNSGITFRSNVPYAHWHQRGAKKHGIRQLPQRAVLVPPRDRKAWVAWVSEYVVEGHAGGLV